MNITVYFIRSSGCIAWLIRALTFSQWNHVAIEINGFVYESSGHFGVRRLNKTDFAGAYKNRESIKISVGSDAKILAAELFLKKQVGKKYDLAAIISIPFLRNWQSDDKWFCSELVAAALVKSGVRKFRIRSNRITPRDLWVSL